VAMRNAFDKIYNVVFLLKKNVTTHIDIQSLAITPMHFGVIRTVRKHQPCTLNILAELMDRDKAQVTRLVNVLEEQSMILRAPNPDDKRSQLLQLRSKGEDVFSKLDEIGVNVTQKMFKGISESDQALYEEITDKIITNLSNK